MSQTLPPALWRGESVFVIWLFCFYFSHKSNSKELLKPPYLWQPLCWEISIICISHCRSMFWCSGTNHWVTWSQCLHTCLSDTKFCCILDDQFQWVPPNYWKILHTEWCQNNHIFSFNYKYLALKSKSRLFKHKFREIWGNLLWNL